MCVCVQLNILGYTTHAHTQKHFVKKLPNDVMMFVQLKVFGK